MAEQGFYPYQAPVDAYGNGGFRFAEMSHRGSILCLPSGMHAWDVQSPQAITLASLELALDCANELDVLFIGTGDDMAFIPEDIRAAFRERQVILEAVATGGAARTYNILLGEDRQVGAAMIAVEHAARR